MPRKKPPPQDIAKSYPFSVRRYYAEEDQHPLGPHWMEQCRCESLHQARGIARALSIVSGSAITVVVDARGEYIAHYPDIETFARVMREAKEQETKKRESCCLS
jgi:hypothetical protein